MSVVIARSSDLPMARPNLSFFNERILDVLHGLSCSEDSIRRVSQRSVSIISRIYTGSIKLLYITPTKQIKADNTRITQEVAKKRTRRTVKHQRAIIGASLDVIKERRTQRPEARTAARQAAIKEGKEKKSAAESKKKAEKAKSAANASKGQVGRIQSKQGAKGAPSKVAAKSR
jgi:hypothetical protein